jgi:DNA-binding transcriptional regulator YbjK
MEQALTQEAADCALDVIRFKAWAVTGRDLIVTPEMLPTWRYYLASRYPTLPDRYSVANACWELNNITARWPQMSQVERELWQNMWAASLPQSLALIEPVFPAGAQQLRAALQSRAAQQNAAPCATRNEAGAIAELQRRYEIGNTLLQWWRR